MLEGLGGDGSALAVQIAVAVALLMLGRRLYWFFVAVAGFVVVTDLASEYLDIGDGWVTLALAVAAGIGGALLAVFLQKLAVALAGFVVVAYVASALAESMGQDGTLAMVAVLLAGAIGGAVAGYLFDGSLILMSSIGGAAMLVDALDLRHQAALAVMVVVAIAGVVIQSNILRRDRGAGG